MVINVFFCVLGSTFYILSLIFTDVQFVSGLSLVLLLLFSTDLIKGVSDNLPAARQKARKIPILEGKTFDSILAANPSILGLIRLITLTARLLLIAHRQSLSKCMFVNALPI